MVDNKRDRSKKSDSKTNKGAIPSPLEQQIPLTERIIRKDSDVEKPKPLARGPIPPAKSEG